MHPCLTNLYLPVPRDLTIITTGLIMSFPKTAKNAAAIRRLPRLVDRPHALSHPHAAQKRPFCEPLGLAGRIFQGAALGEKCG